MRMIEVIYENENPKKNKNEILFSIPRNIRQIGFGGDVYRIYIEDYVYTFLCRLSEKEKEENEASGVLAVLTGEIKSAEDITYVFIKGAIVAEGAQAASDHIGFSEEIWKHIQEEEEKYFPFQHVVGWFFSEAQLAIQMTEVFSKVHLQYFGGAERVLMLMDPVEKEDGFFCYENGYFLRRSGYYIYYEKNEPMQTYMLEKNQWMTYEPLESMPDEAVKNFRKILRKKKKGDLSETEGETSVFSYAVTACLVLMIVVTGVNFYKNQVQIRDLEKETAVLDSVLSDEQEEEQDTKSTVENDFAELSDASGDLEENIHDGESEEEVRVMETEVEKITTESELSAVTSPDLTTTPIPQENENAENARTDYTQDAAEFPQKEQKAEMENLENPASAAVEQTTYVIRPGDTLFEISMANYGSAEAIAEICRLNQIAVEEIIYPGQIIVLP